MTLNELQRALIQEYPDGVSFGHLALRLLQRKLPEATDALLEQLKAGMFRRPDEVWLFMQHVMDDEVLAEFAKFADTRSREAGYLTLHALRLRFEGRLRLLHTPADYEAFFAYFFRNPSWRLSQEVGVHALQRPHAEPLQALLERDAARVSAMVEAAGGALRNSDALAELPHLDGESLAVVMKKFAPDIHEVDLDGEQGWQRVDAIHLPDDFSDKLTRILERMLELDFKATLDSVNFALSMEYGVHFRKEHALEDDVLFRRVVEKHYKGAEKIGWRFGARFAKVKEEIEERAEKQSVRIEPKPSQIIGQSGKALSAHTWDCYVRNWNDPRRLEIAHLKAQGVSSAEIAKRYNLTKGTIDGWILWTHHNMPKILELNGMTEADLDVTPSRRRVGLSERMQSEIMGLEGKPLQAHVWKEFKKRYKHPLREEMVKMVAEGMTVAEIAKKVGYCKGYISEIVQLQQRMPKILELNGMTEEDL